jgi:hypothetical protein
MNYVLRPKSLIAATVVTAGVAISAVVAYAAVGAGGGPTASPLAQLKTGAPGPDRFASAAGLNPADAKHVFTLANGVSVGVVGNALSKCLIRTIDGRTGDTCASTADIAEGHGISVGDECGTSGRNLMEITGLAPEGAVSVRLRSSDGTSKTTPVIDGAFRFDGTNPVQGAAYPIGVEWVAASGASMATAALPVEGDNFCLPTSSTPGA